MNTQSSLDNQKNQNQQVDANPDDTAEETQTKYKSRSFNEKIGEAELLADAMGKNIEELSARGGGEEFVNNLKAAIQNAKNTNADQEKTKALLKDLTLNVNKKMDDLDRLVSDGRKIVKMVINQERWVGFGINVTR